MSEITITTLIENHVYDNGLIAEQGLSFLIDTGSAKILFDTGQSGALLHNAEKLGVDLTDVDSLVLSHGHHDHTGGVYPFLKINHKAPVYCKKDAFLKKYNSREKFSGIIYNQELLDHRIRYVSSPTEIFPGITLMPEIPLLFPDDHSISKLKVDKGNGIEIDDFTDELFIAITHNEKLSIISSCSHRGISNITEAARKAFNLPVNLILGGFHIKDCKAEQYTTIINYLNHTAPEQVGVCHCTGVEKYASLKSDCHSRLFYNFTGNVITL
ncbi:MAG: MBL fold metallo-hydrolase [Bacteroidota bacterium]|nr:MBL fold metallo-hydrolase [Bacteroidota bacterium]